MLVSALLAAALGAPPDAPKPFEFKDGDRVVWLGNTLVEREQRYGYWEAALIAANADKNITVRNLGWSGDTVFGDARAGFDTPAKGFERMVSLTLELKPTVIFVSFGTNEAFEGKEGLPKFEKGLEKLLDAIEAGERADRAVLAACMSEPSASLPDPKAANANLALYRDAIKGVAEQAQTRFRRSVQPSPPRPPARSRTTAIHLTEAGYRDTAGFFLSTLGLDPRDGERREARTTPPRGRRQERAVLPRWRPQNETYLFGFRKHEQGKNAKEIAEFDPLRHEGRGRNRQAMQGTEEVTQPLPSPSTVVDG